MIFKKILFLRLIEVNLTWNFQHSASKIVYHVPHINDIITFRFIEVYMKNLNIIDFGYIYICHKSILILLVKCQKRWIIFQKVICETL